MLACVVGCGRLNFGAVSDSGVSDGAVDTVQPVGHDEDGDGIDDALDTCPHIGGPDTDSDDDGVGDLCDPHPGTPGDHIGVFSSLESGTSPFDDITGFTEDPDGLHHVGDTSVFLTRPFGTARVEIGFDILAIIGTNQHQIGVGIARTSDPYYFAELNDNTGATVRDVAILSYDAVNGYVALDSVTIPPLHTGRGIVRIDADATAHTYAAVAGWDGELYNSMAATPLYDGGFKAHCSLNGLDLVIRYIIIIDSP